MAKIAELQKVEEILVAQIHGARGSIQALREILAADEADGSPTS